MPTENDWHLFIAWATAEGWKISFHEQRLFQNQWRPFFFLLKHRGSRCGFVSAVAYKNSGWIGNLLVDPQQRGKGYGSALFGFALDVLNRPNPERIWLTASAQGAPLYRKHGFTTIDRVDRWTAQGLGERSASGNRQVDELIDLDRRCWKESRAPLISLLADDASVIRSGRSLALLQTGTDFWQLGPWLAHEQCPREARLLLTKALQNTPRGKSLMTDILGSTETELLLRQSGFSRQGSCDLMCLSERPAEITGVFALASLGSIG